MQFYNKLFLNLIAVICLLILFYYCFIDSFKNDVHFWYKTNSTKDINVSTALNNKETINVWCIYTKVVENTPLQFKFVNLIKSLFTHTSVPLHIHVISDDNSKNIAKSVLDVNINISKELVQYSFYNVKHCAGLISDIVEVMTPHFSSQPGTYYSDALFYLSLGLHRIASTDQSKAIMLDCDIQFTNDILLLYKEFERFFKLGTNLESTLMLIKLNSRFNSDNIFGLAYELTPVYRHVLYTYRNHKNTSFGEFVHNRPRFASKSHPFGFPGFNSGVMLFNFRAIRDSTLYPVILQKDNVERLAKKFNFKGHLGDQDFYTLLGYEYPHIFRTLPCNFNRQLCVWWRDHGYSDIFGNYSKCDGDIIIYHGNCNTPIPT